MTVTATDIFDIAPEFTTEDVDKIARIERFIARTELMLSKSVFGDLYDLAVMYMTAHMLAVSPEFGRHVGAISSEKVGDVTVNYATVQQRGAVGESLNETSYGREYLSIRSRCVIGATVAGCKTYGTSKV